MKKLLTMLVGIVIPMLMLGQTVPSLVNYQGQLLDSAGTPLANGEYELSLSIYDAATAGGLVWGPQVFDGLGGQGHGPRIPVVSGYFNVILGPVDTNGMPIADALNGTSRYFEIRVGNNPPIAPRQRILSAPFALRAADAEKMGGTNWNAVFDNGSPATGKVPGALIADAGITSAQIANGAVGSLQLADGAVTYSKIADGTIGPGKLASDAVHSSGQISDGVINDAHINRLYHLTASDGNPANAVYVDADGDVGIGTTTPGGSYQLDVIGNIRSVGTHGSVNICEGENSLTLTAGRFLPPTEGPPSILFTYNGLTTSAARLVFNSAFDFVGASPVRMYGPLSVTNMSSQVVGTLYNVNWDYGTRMLTRGTSSKRYKENIEPWHEDAYRILKLEPKQFNRLSAPQRLEIGYIAEDFDEAGLQALTAYDEEGRPDAIDYSRIVIYSNEIIKDQQALLKRQQEQLDLLKGELDQLRRMVTDLKQDRE